MAKNKPKILISTGIYPPQIGGPSEYAKNLKESFEKLGTKISVKTYGKIERILPTGFRHFFYFLKILPKIVSSDYIISLDTFSVGLPTALASKIFGKKNVIRTGGDFLWEAYVERTGDMVLLRDFYRTTKDRWNLKEKLIFKLTNWMLRNTTGIIFSTNWQKDIWGEAYQISNSKQFIIENFYARARENNKNLSNKVFVAGARQLKWKNLESLRKVFAKVSKSYPRVVLDTANLPYPQFLEKIENSYAVILATLGDISPNIILDAIKVGTPFILTQETGLYERLKDVGVFVNPKDEDDVYRKIIWLLDEKNYTDVKNKIAGFNFTHSWDEIANEFLNVYGKI